MKRIADQDVLYLLQYLTTNLVARGYVRHSLTILPHKKHDTWDGIIRRIADKYRTRRGESIFGLSRDQRARRKQQGLLNAALVWWHDRLFILATQGRDDVGLLDGERLAAWPQNRVRIDAGPGHVFEIVGKDGRATVGLSKDCFAAKRAYFEELAVHAPLERLAAAWETEERLLPSYAGLFAQKRKIVRALVHAARQAGRKDVGRDRFVIGSKRLIAAPSV
ncbi:hypothetical protein dsx2_2298 [Desulfovibrio sp. X2]|uniref:hypothetical protein n=1 Tax=Desulfovibrio sp. X2 TaxID=941449 RepID=UPI0003588398|nr:hypothetical protein [Desulfovibrio sp. X2]EPR43447.1 hypothetical protein dsx2_2298 [Desulfovibrio sp. X2]